MPADFDIRPMVEEHSAMPVKRLRVVRTFEELRLSAVRRGVVFVFAAWSGPAILAFQRFTRVMNSMDNCYLDLVVLDTDCLTQDSAVEIFGAQGFFRGGAGEVVWIRDGRVVAREIARDGSEALLEQHKKELLDDHKA